MNSDEIARKLKPGDNASHTDAPHKDEGLTISDVGSFTKGAVKGTVGGLFQSAVGLTEASTWQGIAHFAEHPLSSISQAATDAKKTITTGTAEERGSLAGNIALFGLMGYGATKNLVSKTSGFLARDAGANAVNRLAETSAARNSMLGVKPAVSGLAATAETGTLETVAENSLARSAERAATANTPSLAEELAGQNLRVEAQPTPGVRTQTKTPGEGTNVGTQHAPAASPEPGVRRTEPIGQAREPVLSEPPAEPVGTGTGERPAPASPDHISEPTPINAGQPQPVRATPDRVEGEGTQTQGPASRRSLFEGTTDTDGTFDADPKADANRQPAPAAPVREQQPAEPVREQQPAEPVREQQPAEPVREQQPAEAVREPEPTQPVRETEPTQAVREPQPAATVGEPGSVEPAPEPATPKPEQRPAFSAKESADLNRKLENQVTSLRTDPVSQETLRQNFADVQKKFEALTSNPPTAGSIQELRKSFDTLMDSAKLADANEFRISKLEKTFNNTINGLRDDLAAREIKQAESAASAAGRPRLSSDDINTLSQRRVTESPAWASDAQSARGNISTLRQTQEQLAAAAGNDAQLAANLKQINQSLTKVEKQFDSFTTRPTDATALSQDIKQLDTAVRNLPDKVPADVRYSMEKELSALRRTTGSMATESSAMDAAFARQHLHALEQEFKVPSRASTEQASNKMANAGSQTEFDASRRAFNSQATKLEKWIKDSKLSSEDANALRSAVRNAGETSEQSVMSNLEQQTGNLSYTDRPGPAARADKTTTPKAVEGQPAAGNERATTSDAAANDATGTTGTTTVSKPIDQNVIDRDVAAAQQQAAMTQRPLAPQEIEQLADRRLVQSDAWQAGTTKAADQITRLDRSLSDDLVQKTPELQPVKQSLNKLSEDMSALKANPAQAPDFFKNATEFEQAVKKLPQDALPTEVRQQLEAVSNELKQSANSLSDAVTGNRTSYADHWQSMQPTVTEHSSANPSLRGMRSTSYHDGSISLETESGLSMRGRPNGPFEGKLPDGSPFTTENGPKGWTTDFPNGRPTELPEGTVIRPTDQGLRVETPSFRVDQTFDNRIRLGGDINPKELQQMRDLISPQMRSAQAARDVVSEAERVAVAQNRPLNVQDLDRVAEPRITAERQATVQTAQRQVQNLDRTIERLTPTADAAEAQPFKNVRRELSDLQTSFTKVSTDASSLTDVRTSLTKVRQELQSVPPEIRAQLEPALQQIERAPQVLESVPANVRANIAREGATAQLRRMEAAANITEGKVSTDFSNAAAKLSTAGNEAELATAEANMKTQMQRASELASKVAPQDAEALQQLFKDAETRAQEVSANRLATPSASEGAMRPVEQQEAPAPQTAAPKPVQQDIIDHDVAAAQQQAGILQRSATPQQIEQLADRRLLQSETWQTGTDSAVRQLQALDGNLSDDLVQKTPPLQPIKQSLNKLTQDMEAVRTNPAQAPEFFKSATEFEQAVKKLPQEAVPAETRQQLERLSAELKQSATTLSDATTANRTNFAARANDLPVGSNGIGQKTWTVEDNQATHVYTEDGSIRHEYADRIETEHPSMVTGQQGMRTTQFTSGAATIESDTGFYMHHEPYQPWEGRLPDGTPFKTTNTADGWTTEFPNGRPAEFPEGTVIRESNTGGVSIEMPNYKVSISPDNGISAVGQIDRTQLGQIRELVSPQSKLAQTAREAAAEADRIAVAENRPLNVQDLDRAAEPRVEAARQTTVRTAQRQIQNIDRTLERLTPADGAPEAANFTNARRALAEVEQTTTKLATEPTATEPVRASLKQFDAALQKLPPEVREQLRPIVQQIERAPEIIETQPAAIRANVAREGVNNQVRRVEQSLGISDDRVGSHYGNALAKVSSARTEMELTAAETELKAQTQRITELAAKAAPQDAASLQKLIADAETRSRESATLSHAKEPPPEVPARPIERPTPAEPAAETRVPPAPQPTQVRPVSEATIQQDLDRLTADAGGRAPTLEHLRDSANTRLVESEPWQTARSTAGQQVQSLTKILDEHAPPAGTPEAEALKPLRDALESANKVGADLKKYAQQSPTLVNSVAEAEAALKQLPADALPQEVRAELEQGTRELRKTAESMSRMNTGLQADYAREATTREILRVETRLGSIDGQVSTEFNNSSRQLAAATTDSEYQAAKQVFNRSRRDVEQLLTKAGSDEEATVRQLMADSANKTDYAALDNLRSVEPVQRPVVVERQTVQTPEAERPTPVEQARTQQQTAPASPQSAPVARETVQEDITRAQREAPVADPHLKPEQTEKLANTRVVESEPWQKARTAADRQAATVEETLAKYAPPADSPAAAAYKNVSEALASAKEDLQKLSTDAADARAASRSVTKLEQTIEQMPAEALPAEVRQELRQSVRDLQQSTGAMNELQQAAQAQYARETATSQIRNIEQRLGLSDERSTAFDTASRQLADARTQAEYISARERLDREIGNLTNIDSRATAEEAAALRRNVADASFKTDQVAADAVKKGAVETAAENAGTAPLPSKSTTPIPPAVADEDIAAVRARSQSSGQHITPDVTERLASNRLVMSEEWQAAGQAAEREAQAVRQALEKHVTDAPASAAEDLRRVNESLQTVQDNIDFAQVRPERTAGLVKSAGELEETLRKLPADALPQEVRAQLEQSARRIVETAEGMRRTNAFTQADYARRMVNAELRSAEQAAGLGTERSGNFDASAKRLAEASNTAEYTAARQQLDKHIGELTAVTKELPEQQAAALRRLVARASVTADDAAASFRPEVEAPSANSARVGQGTDRPAAEPGAARARQAADRPAAASDSPRATVAPPVTLQQATDDMVLAARRMREAETPEQFRQASREFEEKANVYNQAQKASTPAEGERTNRFIDTKASIQNAREDYALQRWQDAVAAKSELPTQELRAAADRVLYAESPAAYRRALDSFTKEFEQHANTLTDREAVNAGLQAGRDFVDSATELRSARDMVSIGTGPLAALREKLYFDKGYSAGDLNRKMLSGWIVANEIANGIAAAGNSLTYTAEPPATQPDTGSDTGNRQAPPAQQGEPPRVDSNDPAEQQRRQEQQREAQQRAEEERQREAQRNQQTPQVPPQYNPNLGAPSGGVPYEPWKEGPEPQHPPVPDNNGRTQQGLPGPNQGPAPGQPYMPWREPVQQGTPPMQGQPPPEQPRAPQPLPQSTMRQQAAPSEELPITVTRQMLFGDDQSAPAQPQSQDLSGVVTRDMLFGTQTTTATPTNGTANQVAPPAASQPRAANVPSGQPLVQSAYQPSGNGANFSSNNSVSAAFLAGLTPQQQADLNARLHGGMRIDRPLYNIGTGDAQAADAVTPVYPIPQRLALNSREVLERPTNSRFNAPMATRFDQAGLSQKNIYLSSTSFGSEARGLRGAVGGGGTTGNTAQTRYPFLSTAEQLKGPSDTPSGGSGAEASEQVNPDSNNAVAGNVNDPSATLALAANDPQGQTQSGQTPNGTGEEKNPDDDKDKLSLNVVV